MVKSDYILSRNVTRHDHRDFEFRRVIAASYSLDKLLRRMGRRSRFVQHAFFPPAIPRVDLYHFWRMLGFTSTPWVVTTDAPLPVRWPENRLDEGLELLASDSCRRIIANCLDTVRLQRRHAERRPDLVEDIMRKTEVLHPPQDVVVPSWEEKATELPDQLTLTLVGNQFFRKGGLELLRVVDQFLGMDAPLRLNIVSTLACDPLSKSGPREVQLAREIIARRPQIQVYERLPNSEVLKLFRKSHLGLLPSCVEAYGYSVLEAQACGCATITTDISALPEINKENVGWQVHVAGDEYDYKSPRGRARLSQLIEGGLRKVLGDILDNPASVRTRGEAALERIRREHSPARHADRLDQIYREAIGLA